MIIIIIEIVGACVVCAIRTYAEIVVRALHILRETCRSCIVQFPRFHVLGSMKSIFHLSHQLLILSFLMQLPCRIQGFRVGGERGEKVKVVRRSEKALIGVHQGVLQ